MKLHIEPDPEVRIRRRDALHFRQGAHDVLVAHAEIGNFDSTPYEPVYHSWSYAADLHQHDGRLWICLTEYERVVRLVVEEKRWSEKTTQEKRSVFVSEDEGTSWRSIPPDITPTLDESTRLDHVQRG